MKMLRYIILGITTAVLIFFAFVFFNGKSEKTAEKNISATDAAKNINITKFFNAGADSITLQAQWIGTLSEDIKLFRISLFKRISVKDVQILIKKKEKAVSTVTAKKAVLFIPIKDPDKLSAIFDNPIKLSGNVKVITADRKILFSDKLTLNFIKNILTAEKNCVFNYKGQRKRGSYCTADLLLKNITMKRKINNFLNIF